MDVVHGLERGFGYILLFFALPLFMTLFILFNSHSVSYAFLQNLPNLVRSFASIGFLASLLSFSVISNSLLLSGLVAIAGATLILFGNKGYSGLSKVGKEVLILALISLAGVYATLNILLPTVLSKVSTLNLSGVSTFASSFLSPFTSQMITVDIFFAVFGAALIALELGLTHTNKRLHSKSKKKKKQNEEKFTRYHIIGIPAGAAIAIVLLFVLTFGIVNTTLTVATYQTSSIPANNVSNTYETASSSGTYAILAASNYYSSVSPNFNDSYAGKITLSPSIEPVSFSLPMSLSIAKASSSVKINFELNVSQISTLIDSLVKTNLPSFINLILVYNHSGFTTCSNLAFTSGSGLHCSFTPTEGNFSTVLFGANVSTTNQSLLRHILNDVNKAESKFPAGTNLAVQNISYNSFTLPKLTFVKHAVYSGNDCSLFDIEDNYSAATTSGQVCVLDSNGMPAFFSIGTNFQLGNNQSLQLAINFALSP